jgi:branched-chain amino acid transport system permease protein
MTEMATATPARGHHLDRTLRVGTYLVLAAFLLALPILSSRLQLRLAILAIIWFIAVVGLQVLMGQAGLISIGQAGFVGLGAYTAAIVSVRYGLPFWLSLPIAGLAGALLALLVGLPTLRLRGHYLAIATIGVGEIVYLVLNNWQEMTKGTDGIGNIPRPIDSDTGYYYIALGVAAAVGLGIYLLRRSPVGLAFSALRTDEVAAAAMGVSVGFHTMLAFTIAGLCAGLSGAMFAHYEGYISPGGFTIQRSIVLLSMIVIGGINYISGAVIGAALLVFLPEQLRFLGDAYLVFYGLAVLLVIIFAPQGVAGLILSARDRLFDLIVRLSSSGVR